MSVLLPQQLSYLVVTRRFLACSDVPELCFARPKCSAERDAGAALLRLQRLAAQDLQAQRAELNLRPASFVTSDQTLGLHFGGALPSSLQRGREYSVRLCASNEFGLWSRGGSGGDTAGGPEV